MKYFRFVILVVILMSAIRGAFVYHLGWNASTVYMTTSFCMYFVGVLGTIFLLTKQVDPVLLPYVRLVKLNICVIVFYVLMEYLFLSRFNHLYFAFIPPLIFLLMRSSDFYLESLIIVVMLITSLGVFIISSSKGYDELMAIKHLLRPDIELYVSRVGDYVQAFGYQADNHDVANILMFTSPCLLVRGLYKHKYNYVKQYVDIGMCVVASVALFMTASASNIFVFLSITSIILIKNKKKLYAAFFLILIVALFKPAILLLVSEKMYFLSKFHDQSQLVGGGMFNSLSFESFINSAHAILFGFGYILDVPMQSSEVSFIKILIQYGILGLFVILNLLFLPMLYSQKLKKTNPTLKSNQEYQYMNGLALAIASGGLSLLHYGSLFRITSIGTFILLLTLFFKKYIKLVKVE